MDDSPGPATEVDPDAVGSLPTRSGSTPRYPGARSPLTPPPAYTSPQSRERALRIALLATAGAAVLAGLAAFERYRFASDGLRIGAVTPDRLDALGHRRGITDVLLILAAAAAAVAWLMWFARIYGNLRAFGAAWTRVSRPTAVVSCAVPPLNLFMAPWLTAEAWNISDPEEPGRRTPGSRRLPPLQVVVWTAVGLVTLLAGGLAEKVAHRTLGHLGAVRSGAPLEVVAAVLVVVSALLTARLAASLTARQDAAAAALGATPTVDEPS